VAIVRSKREVIGPEAKFLIGEEIASGAKKSRFGRRGGVYHGGSLEQKKGAGERVII